MAKFDFGAVTGPHKRKLTYLGHKPLGVKVSGQQKERQHRRAIVNDYKKESKVSNSSLPDEIFTKNEQVIERRLKRVRQRMLKQAKFSLADDSDDDDDNNITTLTSGGRTIDSLGDGPKDDFDDQDLAGLDSSDEEGNIGADETALHFGGGGEEDDEPAKKKSRKDAYKEIMAKSKRAKAEEARTKVQQNLLLHEMDARLDDLKKDLDFRPPKNTEAGHKLELEERQMDRLLDRRHPKEKEQEDEFDALMRQMKSAPSGVAGARTKTPAEIALEKAKKLEAIEKERLSKLKQFVRRKGSARSSDEEDEDDDEGDSSSSSSNSDDNDSSEEEGEGGNPWTHEASDDSQESSDDSKEESNDSDDGASDDGASDK